MQKEPTSYLLPPTSYKSGFSLLEIILFVGMFSAVIVGFLSILVSVSGVSVKNSAAAEVASQSQFLLQTIQYNVERSSVIEMTKDSAGSTLTLRMSSSGEDPTTIALSGTTVVMTPGSGGARNLTSSKVKVTDLSFTKRENPFGHDSVAVNFTMEYNTDAVARRFVHMVQTSVARVSAATFDSNVIPNASSYDLGSTANPWRSGYFNTSVGIGIAPAATPLQVAGGNIYVSDAGNGVLLKNPAGTACYLLTVTDVGAVTTATSTCL